MDHPAPTPVAVFGKDPDTARAVSVKLLPDFEVIHVCLDLPTALAELPLLFSPDPASAPPAPASGIGTNACTLDPAARRSKRPQALFFGGRIDDDEYRAVVEAVKRAITTGNPGGNAADVHFIKVQKRDALAEGSLGPPGPDVIARIFRKKMAAAVAQRAKQ